MPGKAINPLIKARNVIAMREYKKAKSLMEGGSMSKETFKKNFRGAIALRTGKAYKIIQTEYHAWLRAHNHPIPKPSAPRPKKKKKPKEPKAPKAKKTKKSKK
jgi:hypothetical protein